jgi:hypothetical protein
MQAINSFSRKAHWLFITAVAFSFMLGISSCKTTTDEDNDENDPDIEMAESLIAPPPVRLTYGQINRAWKSAQINDISYLTFYPTYNRLKGEYNVFFQAFKSNNNKIGKGKKLRKDDNDPVTIPSTVILSDNIIDLAALQIVDATGKLKKFKHLLLTYKVYSDTKTTSDYLQYEVQVINEDGSGGISDDALPCPPCQNCRPIPAGCLIQADTTKDNPIDTIRKN